MRILTFDNIQDLARQTEVLMKELLETRGDVLRGFFPTGKSAEEFYKRLRADQFWHQRFQGLQIDEFAQPDHLFLTQLREQVILPLGLEDQFETIDPSWTASEMKTHISQVLSHPIDFALLGLGPNGHVGFQEPFVGDAQFLGGRVDLTEQSSHRVKGAVTHTALTFGAGSFLKAEKIFLLVVGAEKETIYRQFLASEPTPALPATLLKNHKDFTVLTTFKGGAAG